MTPVLDDSVLSVTRFSPVCTFCLHSYNEFRKCKAFSREIPLEIWEGKNDHRNAVDGDHGIQFRARE